MPTTSLEKKTFILLLVLVTIAFFWILLPFYGAVFWAVALAVVFAPLQRRMARRIGGRGNLSALLTLVICLLVAILPVIFITSAMVAEGTSLYQRIESGELDVGAYVTSTKDMLPAFLQQQLDRFGMDDMDGLREQISSSAAAGSQYLATKVFAIGQGTFQFIISFFVMLYLLFFLLRDGQELVRDIRMAIPLGENTKRRLQIKFTRVVRATVKGNIVVAAVQGALGGLIFWGLGISSPLLWGVLMAFLSLLPAVGAGLVWAPVAIYLFLNGSIWQSVVLTLFGVLVIGLVDNILRPILVGKDTRMPDYLILISTLGGMALFGLNGFVLGPLVAALFVASWNLFSAGKKTVRLPE
ncbi:AI-2E family transporter [Pseudomonas daroniae]|uniref:AI-2E family transporter n=1 Tax=Phytopseudomonas daroniae TaxID=2487519 RepID=A0A4Q9QH25_9GAMM|nr:MULTISPECIES: AI-2E family transporter [Pseudomonas]TBU73636.1 AI-2E family transporter [Pseudomonas daroniae]TBU73882.1 AI-2E family transporter [Pseudomonas daroniae]TBU74891.1 AI-2E family transporter [Pseudomonas sp. FRB 228]TBU88780.1 AI-2E family transporter [Pseudomonas daroniae]